MSLVIRFSNAGKKGERKYRIVVKEKRSKRDGKAIDQIGFFEKSISSQKKSIDEKKLALWLSRGAKVSAAVKRIL